MRIVSLSTIDTTIYMCAIMCTKQLGIICSGNNARSTMLADMSGMHARATCISEANKRARLISLPYCTAQQRCRTASLFFCTIKR